MASILGQRYTDLELLIIDDGSTDNSHAIMRNFDDPRIRILQNPRRLKLSGALNRGLGEARGSYIARMDADDIAEPQRLGEQMQFLDRHADIGLCGSAVEIFGEGVGNRIENYPKTTEKIKAYALFDSPFCHPAVMARKALFNDYNLRYDGSYYPTEDYELWTRAIDIASTANLKETLLRYRVHNGSMTGSDWDQMDRQATRIIRGELDKLGIPYSEEELILHRNIGRGRSCRFREPSKLDQAEVWLGRLIDVNRERQRYDAAALSNTIALIWFRLCMNNTVHGLLAFKNIGRVTIQRAM